MKRAVAVLARRRRARRPAVVRLHDGRGRTRTLPARGVEATQVLEAAERVLLAAQRAPRL